MSHGYFDELVSLVCVRGGHQPITGLIVDEMPEGPIIDGGDAEYIFHRVNRTVSKLGATVHSRIPMRGKWRLED